MAAAPPKLKAAVNSIANPSLPIAFAMDTIVLSEIFIAA